ncbi:hypothetical protein AVEN_198051-1 [Araneus ventricosus]|uniref:Uncharacterized protein n=1 Tax=Araneus ventricosus TaxID=182803 RepID=A0A4Y2NRC3_ARAVE|nr:hypothetical protein AVEN_198051-1 [Araneus ventricosus]
MRMYSPRLLQRKGPRYRDEDLIPITLSRQCSIPDNVQDGLVIDRHTGPDHNSAYAKCDTFAHKCKIIPSATFSADHNPPLSGCTLIY